jgi:hypothetical protein
VDETLAKLKRAVEANPSDVEAFQAYEAALTRAGHDDEVTDLYRFKFQCAETWDAMTPVEGEPNARRCAKCDRNVYHVTSPAELGVRVDQGDCVSFWGTQAQYLRFMVERPDVHPAQEAGSVCLVPRDIPQPPDPLPMPRPDAVRLTGKPRRLPDGGLLERLWRSITGG